MSEVPQIDVDSTGAAPLSNDVNARRAAAPRVAPGIRALPSNYRTVFHHQMEADPQVMLALFDLEEPATLASVIRDQSLSVLRAATQLKREREVMMDVEMPPLLQRIGLEKLPAFPRDMLDDYFRAVQIEA
ncbi:hypothetical protein V5F77_16015 [Xanthobacter sp. DSM 24535]|uniref:hypothetical protein n=1 Tax=Roseixanthobacter psychrophilus TaxID=3119917 RepID=UPI0037261AB5